MTPSTIDTTCAYIAEVFPRSKWEAGEYDHFKSRLRPIDITLEQAKAAVGEYKANCRWATPIEIELVGRLKHAENKRGAGADGSDPRSWPMWKRYAAWGANVGWDRVPQRPQNIIGKWHWEIGEKKKQVYAGREVMGFTAADIDVGTAKAFVADCVADRLMTVQDAWDIVGTVWGEHVLPAAVPA